MPAWGDPVPVPATAELIAQYGLPVSLTDTKGEMITPTGAAIAAALRSRELLPEEMVIRDIGIGAGTKEFPHANILRAMIVSEIRKPEDVWVLETNVDDCSGEQLGFSAGRTFQTGGEGCGVSSGLYEEKQTGISAAGALPGGDGGGGGGHDFPGIYEHRHPQVPGGKKCTGTENGEDTYKIREIRMKICYRSNHVYTYPEYEDIRRAATKRRDRLPGSV